MTIKLRLLALPTAQVSTAIRRRCGEEAFTKIVSRLLNHKGTCDTQLSTNGRAHKIAIMPKDDGKGSRANGGELLCLALASCFCNDICREAASRSIEVVGVEVEVEAQFGGIGEPAKSVEYTSSVAGRAGEAELRDLVEHTDRVTEIQNTIRQGMPVELVSFDVKSVA